MKKIKVLFFGDIVGRIGRRALARELSGLKKEYNPDLVVANGENLAHGSGITEKTAQEVFDAGVDLLTGGNHLKTSSDFADLLNAPESNIIRPLNYPPGLPGRGLKVIELGKHKILVVNFLGRTFMHEVPDDPFRGLDEILKEYADQDVSAIVVDFHAEATSEKAAFGWYADGKVAAVLGTHTHVPTADAKILPEGTAYITDIGMVGARDGVIGVEKTGPITGFLTQTRQHFEPPETGVAQINAVLLEINPSTGRATKLDRVDRETEV
jgi:2',3'-cyclic-nucleotide 2'-phosphodiesterase